MVLNEEFDPEESPTHNVKAAMTSHNSVALVPSLPPPVVNVTQARVVIATPLLKKGDLAHPQYNWIPRQKVQQLETQLSRPWRTLQNERSTALDKRIAKGFLDWVSREIYKKDPHLEMLRKSLPFAFKLLGIRQSVNPASSEYHEAGVKLAKLKGRCLSPRDHKFVETLILAMEESAKAGLNPNLVPLREDVFG